MKRSRFDHALGKKTEPQPVDVARSRNPKGTIPDDVMKYLRIQYVQDDAYNTEAMARAFRLTDEADRSLGSDVMFEAARPDGGRTNAATVHTSFFRLPDDQKRDVLRRIRSWLNNQMSNLNEDEDAAVDDNFNLRDVLNNI